MTIMENTFLLRQWSAHHWAFFFKHLLSVRNYQGLGKKYSLPCPQKLIKAWQYKKYCWSRIQTYCIKSKKSWILPSLQIWYIPYSTKQYFQKLVFLKIPRCSMFILASISKQEMHKIDNAFKFDHSLDISEEKLIIILLHRNVLAFPQNRKVG